MHRGSCVSVGKMQQTVFCTIPSVPVLCNSTTEENGQHYSQKELKWEEEGFPMQQDSRFCPLRIYSIYIEQCKQHLFPLLTPRHHPSG